MSSLVDAGVAQFPQPATLELLETGEVSVETIRSDESGGAGRFAILIKAPVEAIWDVIYSCEKAKIFVNGLKLCDVLEDDGIRTLTHQVVKTSWLVPTQDFIVQTLREPFGRAEFKRISGKPKLMEGSWDFHSTSQGVVAVHELRVQPSVPVPRFIVRHLMSKSMPEMLACIRGLAGGSLSGDSQSLDLASCPGLQK